MANGNTSAPSPTLGASTLRAELLQALAAAVQPLKPVMAYTTRGQWATVDFNNGTVAELEHNKQAVLVIVLTPEQAALLPKGAMNVLTLDSGQA